MIHGQTKIELYNPNTKIKEIIKSENTFQSTVLANYMRSLGVFNNNPYANNNFRNAMPWVNLVGGILLFKNAIDISGGNVAYMPAGNEMIGNGSYGVSNGSESSNPTEMGSWNANESSASASAITQVYDFTTSQSNGQISCIALTSKTGGYIGYGNASGKQKSLIGIGDNQNHSDLANIGFIIGNIAYRFSLSGTTLTVTKKRIPVTQGSVFDRYDVETKTYDLSTIGNHSSLSGNACFCQDGTDIYFFKKNRDFTVANGSTFYYYKLDTTTDTITEESLLNNTGKTIYPCSSWDGNAVQTSSMANGKLFARAADDKVAVIDLSTGVTDILTTGTYTQQGYISYLLSDGLVYSCINQKAHIYDCETNTFKMINASTGFKGAYNPSIDALCIQDTNSYAIKNPLYLATINNLQSPVTKTSAQTMKVTYTLTEA